MSATVTHKGFVAFCEYLLPAVKDGRMGRKEWARAAMLSFGDLPSIPSGLVSKTLLWTHEPTGRTYRKSRVTHEHFKTRTKTCREIVHLYMDDRLTPEMLEIVIEEGRQVHFVDELENIALRPFQQDESILTWQEEYEKAGIELVPDPGTFGNKTYYYKIDEIYYADANEAADATGVHSKTVKARCNNVKWPDWHEIKYEFTND